MITYYKVDGNHQVGKEPLHLTLGIDVNSVSSF